jgi:hypothetical protein
MKRICARRRHTGIAGVTRPVDAHEHVGTAIRLLLRLN